MILAREITRLRITSPVIEVDVSAGTMISTAAEEAVALASALNTSIKFLFNGTECVAQPKDQAQEVVERWDEKRRRGE